MGNKIFESKPTIIGFEKGTKLIKEEQNYFDRINTLLKLNYESNLYSTKNLIASLELKRFDKSKNQIKHIKEDISWIDYINKHLDFVLSKNNNIQWASELKFLISKEMFFYENNYFSNFFYTEYSFETLPQALNDIENNINYNNETNSHSTLDDLDNSLENNHGYEELDVTDNLGGSYMEMNLDSLDKKDPTVLYYMKRKNLKKYIKEFKEHIFNNKKHPINRIVTLFAKTFCKYINQNIENFNEQLKSQLIIGENYENNIKNFEKEVTSHLQSFISVIHSSLKLFYSTIINYACFDEEKDDLINLVTCLFFKTGKLYESIYSLYSMSYSKEVDLLQEKLNKLKNVKPKDLGVDIKYCLDEDTLELQRNILKEKQKEKEDKNKDIDVDKDKSKDKKETDLFKIKEIEDEKENEEEKEIEEEKEKENEDENDNDTNNENKSENETNIKIDNIININNNINTNSNSNQNNDIDDGQEKNVYLLEKIKEDLAIDVKTDLSFSGFEYLRNTINSFNNKKYLFPKVKNNIRDTLALNDQYIKEVKSLGKLPIPYYSAINLLKNLKNYKTPFEKIVILAAISDQITESVSTFWSSMKKYIKKSYLDIEADDLKNIFIFIVIKSQIPDLLIESKFVTNFTTSSTQNFNICYNLILMEVSLENISNMDNIKGTNNIHKQLKGFRETIDALTTQRLSRISRESLNCSPFS